MSQKPKPIATTHAEMCPRTAHLLVGILIASIPSCCTVLNLQLDLQVYANSQTLHGLTNESTEASYHDLVSHCMVNPRIEL